MNVTVSFDEDPLHTSTTLFPYDLLAPAKVRSGMEMEWHECSLRMKSQSALVSLSPVPLSNGQVNLLRYDERRKSLERRLLIFGFGCAGQRIRDYERFEEP